MSPTAILTRCSRTSVPGVDGWVGGGVYPGWCGEGYTGVGAWEGYTGTPARPSQDPKLVYSEAKGPTHGQMKLNYWSSDSYDG